jgi:hypothetical protein
MADEVLALNAAGNPASSTSTDDAGYEPPHNWTMNGEGGRTAA